LSTKSTLARSLFPATEAENVNKQKLAKAWAVVENGQANGAFAGAVALVARNGKTILHKSCGYATIIPTRKKLGRDAIFDLASITKSIATTTAILMLIEKNLISLDTKVSSIIRSFSNGKVGNNSWRNEVAIRHLLTHTSGLPSWYEFYTRVSNKEELLNELCNNVPLSAAPGTRFEYSDIGFMLLGIILEIVSGKELSKFTEENIFGPLKMSDTSFNPPQSKKRRIVATEFSNWRGKLVYGKVHDENAYVMGGVSGHAGLFSTAKDLSVFCQCLLNGVYNNHRLLSNDMMATMRTNQTRDLGGYYGLGWRVKTEMTPGIGSRLSSQAFGHNGYTGTSVWIDPEHNLVMILLTNRIHPVREGDPSSDKSVGIMMKRKSTWNEVNQDFQNAVMDSLVP
jgi:CubicO group peptidase (beta-lactamase class C family)